MQAHPLIKSIPKELPLSRHEFGITFSTTLVSSFNQLNQPSSRAVFYDQLLVPISSLNLCRNIEQLHKIYNLCEFNLPQDFRRKRCLTKHPKPLILQLARRRNGLVTHPFSPLLLFSWKKWKHRRDVPTSRPNISREKSARKRENGPCTGKG